MGESNWIVSKIGENPKTEKSQKQRKWRCEDDMKNGDFLRDTEPITLDLESQRVNSSSLAHGRKRSNSFHSPSSPSALSGKYMTAYSSMQSASTTMNSSTFSTPPSTLSPVTEPVSETPSESVSELSSDIMNGKRKESPRKSPRKKSPRKEKENPMKDMEEDINRDLGVEEAIDVTDIFPPQKKKKGKKKKKKKNKE